MSSQTIVLKISRYDPGSEVKPHFETFEVPYIDGMSVLQALDYVYENIDPSLAYYDHAACAQGICRRCNIVINGKMGLMCHTEAQDGMILQTPERFKVIKDLVYDRGDK